MVVKLVREDPVNTFRNADEKEAWAVTRKSPGPGAVQLHHAELCPFVGSSGSKLAK